MPEQVLSCLRARTLSRIAAAAAVALGSYTAQASEPGQDVIGTWKFVVAIKGVDISSLDESEARELIGKAMTITPEGARFGTRICGAPSFAEKRVEPNLYLQSEAGVNAAGFGLPNPVTVVDISCTEVLLKKHDRAVIFWKGWFFEAVRIKGGRGAKHRKSAS